VGRACGWGAEGEGGELNARKKELSATVETEDGWRHCRSLICKSTGRYANDINMYKVQKTCELQSEAEDGEVPSDRSSEASILYNDVRVFSKKALSLTRGPGTQARIVKISISHWCRVA
jgi:hypothetical protein